MASGSRIYSAPINHLLVKRVVGGTGWTTRAASLSLGQWCFPKVRTVTLVCLVRSEKRKADLQRHYRKIIGSIIYIVTETWKPCVFIWFNNMVSSLLSNSYIDSHRFAVLLLAHKAKILFFCFPMMGAVYKWVSLISAPKWFVWFPKIFQSMSDVFLFSYESMMLATPALFLFDGTYRVAPLPYSLAFLYVFQ